MVSLARAQLEWVALPARRLRGVVEARAALERAVARVNTELSVIERVRRFITADEPFTIENEQLTPSMKIRRHVIAQAYGDRLAALYGR